MGLISASEKQNAVSLTSILVLAACSGTPSASGSLGGAAGTTGGQGGVSVGGSSASGGGGVQARKINDLVDSVAVNTHIIYYDGGYADLDAVLANLAYLGVVHVRDALISSNFYDQSLYGPWFSKLAKAGIRFNLIANGGSAGNPFNPAQAVAGAQFVAAMQSGAVEAIEGFNEINNFAVSYQSETSYTAAGAAMRALYTAVKADASLATLPVYDLTGGEFAPAAVGLNTITGHADFANQHPYPQRGDQPAQWIADGFTHYNGNPPKVITEFGYYTAPNDTTGWGGVAEDLQAKLILNGLADALLQGISRTYIYELVDVLPNAADWGNHWGLFRSDHSPKPSATAIHNLMTVTANVNGAFAPGRLDYKVSSLPTYGNQLLYQTSDGTFILILWNEPDKWDESNHKQLPTSPVDVNVDLGSSYQSVRVFDPILGTNPVATHDGKQSIVVPVDDHPVLVLVK